MKQINNGFLPYYYLTIEGKVYNDNTKKYLKEDIRHCVSLQTIEHKSKKKTIKELYKLIYNKNYCIDNIEDLKGEVWKEIEGGNGLYLISNYSRVKSLIGYNARILKPTITNRGYCRLDLILEGQRQSKLLHRLVAAAFLMPPKHIDYQLHHKDFNKLNNTAANLEWLSVQQHAKKHTERREQLKNDREKESIS